MKTLLTGFFAATLLTAQVPPQTKPVVPPRPAQPSPRASALLALPADAVVATIDGQKVRAAELQVVLRALAPGQQEAAMSNPSAFLQQFGLMRRLAGLAEKGGLDQKSPIKEQLAYNRMLALAQSQLQTAESQVTISNEEVKKFYDGNPDLFTTTKVKVIYIPFSASAGQASPSGKKVLSESEAKAKAEKLFADLKAGGDFVKAVKEHSEDTTSASKEGDFGTLRRSDRLPPEISMAVFALKTGEISPPVRQPNGFYIFRAEEVSVEPLEKVRSQVNLDLRTSRFNEWVQSTQKSVEVKIENEAAFAPAAPPAPAAVK